MEEEKSGYKRRKYPKKTKKVEAVVEIPEMEKEEEIPEVEEKVEVEIVEVKKPIERKIIGMRYFISYVGKATHISLSGVGKLIPGKEYKVRKEVADFLDSDKEYKVRRESVFEE